jgi:hypothetical protein
MKPRKTTGDPRCVICGTTKNIKNHHIGGRNHLAWATMPLCLSHHRQCHILLANSGIDLNYTLDPLERLLRASKAITIFQCMVQEAMHHTLLAQAPA